MRLVVRGNDRIHNISISAQVATGSIGRRERKVQREVGEEATNELQKRNFG